MAPCMVEYLEERSRMGPKNFSLYCMKATKAPKERCPRTISPPPYQMMSPTATEERVSTRA